MGLTHRTNPFLADPYGAAMRFIREALERALADGVSEGLSEAEFDTLERIAFIVSEDSRFDVDPIRG